jgi:hypothetical protein
MPRLRLGLAASALLVMSTGGVAACGSLSAGNSAGFGPSDAGSMPDASEDVTTDSPMFGAEGGPDAIAADAAPDAAPPPPGVLLVHASPSLPDLRFCWSVGGAGPSMTDRPYPFATPMPASNYPGVPVGGAAPLGDASSMLGGSLTVYALDAQAVAKAEQGLNCSGSNQCSCNEMVKQNGLLDPTAIHQMPAITSGAIAPGATVVLWVRGCLGTAGDPQASVQRCGSDWTSSGTGNLRVDATPIPGASALQPDAGILAVQAAQLSPALAVLAGDAGALVSFGAQGGADASAVTTLSAPDQILPAAPQQVATGIPLASYGKLGFAVDVAGDAGAHLWMSLAQSLDLVDPTQDPSQYFTQPTSYLVTVVGDPAGAPPAGTPDASYDGTGLHLLVLRVP